MSRVSATAPLFFLFISALAQVIGFSAGLAIGASLYGWSEPLTFSTQIASHLVISLAIARWQDLPLPWQLLNALLPLALQLELPWQLFAIASALAVLIYLPTFWTRVPYYPTNKVVYQSIAEILPQHGSFVMIDLGCGFGSLLQYLTQARQNGKFVGVEIGPLPYLISKLRFLFNPRVAILFKDFWRLSLEPYQYVYAFLAPHPMELLWEKFRQEANNGALFITNSFTVKQQADWVKELDCPRQPRLFIFEQKTKGSKKAKAI